MRCEAARVSVVLPACNRPQFLRQAVDSVRKQTYPAWELLIADDGSDAPTRRYLREIAAPGHILVLELPHTGRPAVARNAALERAAGGFVAFLDSDDLWTARKLEIQLQALLADPQSGWSYSAFRNVDAQGRPLPGESTRCFVPASGQVFERMLRGELSIRTPAVMARRDLLRSAGNFDGSLASAEDYDLWLRLALRSPVKCLDEALVDVRHHDQHHSADWSEAYRGQERTFLKLADAIPDALRPALKRARVRNAVRCADDHGARGHLADGFRELRRCALFSWNSPLFWRQLARMLSRVALPRATRSRRVRPL